MAALSESDIDKLVRYLDPEQAKALSQPDALAAFQKSLDDNMKKKYESAFQSAAAMAKSKDGNGRTKELAVSGTMVQFVSHSSWRGTRWSFHITPAELEVQKIGQLKMDVRIGDLQALEGKFANLWPSVYHYEAKISNDYASEDLSGNVDLTVSKSKALDLARNLKTKLSIRLPQVKNLSFTLNGKPLEAQQQDLTLSPAPQDAKFQVKGKVLGLPIEESVAIDTSKTSQVNLAEPMNKGISKAAVKVIYDAALSWCQADNAGDPALLRAANPEGAYYKNAAAKMTAPSSNKTTLVKVAVDPSTIQIKDDGIVVEATEHYLYEKSTSFFLDEKNSMVNWRYTLQKMPDKDEWWIVSHDSVFLGRNLFNLKTAEVKTNPDAPAAN
ncbi:hypothetical protein [Gorillibacterium sp. sgz5001074]|uniref:hypothetical protein n=1 Tax=Gorillibacterium sp. sgz5001074 TaxID=3446695 RepID=UPI003F67F997